MTTDDSAAQPVPAAGSTTSGSSATAAPVLELDGLTSGYNGAAVCVTSA